MIKRFFLISGFFWVAGCGDLKLSDKIPDKTKVDPPAGTLVAQGTFATTAPEKTVTGAAKIYAQEGGSLILRVESMTVPNESGLKLRLLGTQAQLLFETSFSNLILSQNYTLAGVTEWGSVEILQSSNQTVYGTATLTAVTTHFDTPQVP